MPEHEGQGKDSAALQAKDASEQGGTIDKIQGDPEKGVHLGAGSTPEKAEYEKDHGQKRPVSPREVQSDDEEDGLPGVIHGRPGQGGHKVRHDEAGGGDQHAERAFAQPYAAHRRDPQR